MGLALSSDSLDFRGRHAPRAAKTIVWVIFICLFLMGVQHLGYAGLPRWQTWVTVADMALLLCFQLVLAGRHARRFRQTPLGYAALIAQAIVGVAPVATSGDERVGLAHFMVGSTLLILPPRWRWLGFGAAAATLGAMPLLEHKTNAAGSSAVAAIVTGLVVYGLTTMANTVKPMDVARTEMAKTAVQAERLRFARDLHDLLGYSLSAISLKSELTHRLMDKSPQRAREELTQIVDISRQALADVRSVASGYRELSLEEEADTARAVLNAAEVQVRMDIGVDADALPVGIRTVLATVLREDVTNILRHSKAEHCEVLIRQTEDAITIEITNDGVRPAPGTGSGILNLSSRVASFDGRLTAGIACDGRYLLRATVPLGREFALS